MRWMLAAACALAAGLCAWGGGEEPAPERVAWIEIEGELRDRPDPFAWLSGENASPSLRDIVNAIDRAAADESVRGIVLRLYEPALGLTQVEEIGAALLRAEAAGRTTRVFADNFERVEVTLGAYANQSLVQAGGSVTLPGLQSEEMYLADALRWIGLEPDYVQVGAYKGAADQIAQAGPSEAWSSNIERLLDELYGAMRTSLRQGLGLSEAELDRAMSEAFLASGEHGAALGLIDGEVDAMELDLVVAEEHGEDFEWADDLVRVTGSRRIDPSNPLLLFQALMRPPSHEPRRDTIAVLHIDGAIVDGDSAPGGLLGEGEVGARTLRETMLELEEQDRVKGVVLRINSPGGSATASESIWQGLRALASVKPVWVSVGDMAASGGYYCAVAGDRIYVNPSSIVGSIGVVGGKVALDGAMEKLRINAVTRTRGPRAGLLSVMRPWTEEEREFVRGRMTETYELFTDRVRAGRPEAEMREVGEGRLFAGAHAVELGMADEIGGLAEAIAALAAELGLEKGGYDVMDYPGPGTLDEFLSRMFDALPMAGVRAEAGAEALRAMVGDDAWPGVRRALRTMALLRDERVLLVSPRVLAIR